MIARGEAFIQGKACQFVASPGSLSTPCDTPEGFLSTECPAITDDTVAGFRSNDGFRHLFRETFRNEYLGRSTTPVRMEGSRWNG